MPVSTDTFVLGTEARLISASPENPKRIYNAGASAIGRNTTSAVVSSDNQITTGQSYEATSAFWYVSAASSRIFVFDQGGQITGGSIRTPDVYTLSGPPVSGLSRGVPGPGKVDAGGLLLDTVNGNLYVNEGTLAAPYFTPVSYDQPGLIGWTLGKRGVGPVPALADTSASYVLPSSGIRLFGQGKEQGTDTGIATGAAYEGGVLSTLHVTNEDQHLTALGTAAGIFQPDTHGTMAVDVEFTDVADILTSAVYLGFIGTAADALDPVVTGATTTGTLVLDDLAGMFADSNFTDVNGIMMVSEKSNLAGTKTGLTAVADRPAAGTYSRWRVEVDSSGYAICFFNKAEVGVIEGATGAGAHASTTSSLDADEEVSPVFYVQNRTTTTRTASIKTFDTWGVSP